MNGHSEVLARWMGTDEPPSGARARVHDLAARLREAAVSLVMVDAEAAGDEQLGAAEAAADALVDALGRLPDLSAHGSPARAPVPASLLHERSPVSGRVNPVSVPLALEYFEDRVVGRVVFTEQFEGPAGGVHGGIVSAVFDEILGVAQMASGSAGYTGTLEVTYRRVTPINREVVYEAGVEKSDGRKLWMWANSTVDGHLLAEAKGLFIVQQHLPLPVGPDPGLSPPLTT